MSFEFLLVHELVAKCPHIEVKEVTDFLTKKSYLNCWKSNTKGFNVVVQMGDYTHHPNPNR
jgi:hypothetical protein